jgi:hypothetical protein
LDKPTPATIQEVVTKVIEDKRKDGEVDESDLTYRDLEKIGAAFSKRLIGVLHARIEYPEPPKEANGKKQEEIGDSDSQSGESANPTGKTAGAGRTAAAE